MSFPEKIKDLTRVHPMKNTEDCYNCEYMEMGCQCEKYMAAGCIPTPRKIAKRYIHVSEVLAVYAEEMNGKILVYREPYMNLCKMLGEQKKATEERKQKLQQLFVEFKKLKPRTIDNLGDGDNEQGFCNHCTQAIPLDRLPLRSRRLREVKTRNE